MNADNRFIDWDQIRQKPHVSPIYIQTGNYRGSGFPPRSRGGIRLASAAYGVELKLELRVCVPRHPLLSWVVYIRDVELGSLRANAYASPMRAFERFPIPSIVDLAYLFTHAAVKEPAVIALRKQIMSHLVAKK